ncbi:MAG: hypothetical protein ABW166_09595 [Sedimenticola sp.]
MIEREAVYFSFGTTQSIFYAIAKDFFGAALLRLTADYIAVTFADITRQTLYIGSLLLPL